MNVSRLAGSIESMRSVEHTEYSVDNSYSLWVLSAIEKQLYQFLGDLWPSLCCTYLFSVLR
jgi:hypothetical protein